MTSRRWTNRSVLRMAGNEEPIHAVTQRARDLVVRAMDEAGWSGPPFDPILLAEYLRIPVVPRDDVREARTVPVGPAGVRIEYNPSRPPARRRYSVAHEIAHTLFPDCRERVRNRAEHAGIGDDWQLEALCNIAAAEILMPVGSLPPLDPGALSIHRLLDLKAQFGVSMEALLIRVVRVTEQPCGMFCASPVARDPWGGHYRMDYVIRSQSWPTRLARRPVIESSVLAECTSIGYTATGDEPWGIHDESLHIECVGVAPYPGGSYPRVVGIMTGAVERAAHGMKLVRGSAVEPRGQGPKLVVVVVNNRARTWGGGGFAQAVRQTWPAVHSEFRRLVTEGHARLALGDVLYLQAASDIVVAAMVCQRGYGDTPTRRVVYGAVVRCLANLADRAKSAGASVHIPLGLGCGAGGGASWDVIRELASHGLVSKGVEVFVYQLPGKAQPIVRDRQLPLVE